MEAFLPYYADHLLLFFMVLARLAGLVMTAPVFGSRSVPFHVRGLLAVCLALLITPLQWHAAADLPRDLTALVAYGGVEAMLGLSLGLAVTLLFGGLELGGRLIGQASGLALADVAGGEMGHPVPVHSQLLHVLGLAVFVSIGGHRLLMTALLDGFQAIPPGGGTLPVNIVDTLTLLLTESFRLGIRAAAPALTAILIASVAVGLAGRAAPHLGGLTLSLALNTLIALIMLLLSLAAIVYLFVDQIRPFLETWQMML